MTTHFKLLVFDWDGTLVDSIEKIVSSLQAASETTFGIQITHDEARNVIGLGLVEAVTALHPEMDPTSIDRVVEAYKQHFLHENTIVENLFDGVEAMLDELKTAGYILAIATSKSRIGYERSVNSHKLGHYFDASECASESMSKPHPRMLENLYKRFEIEPENALMIGDSKHDLQMAINANTASIGVTQGAHTAEELSAFEPLTCLDDIAELVGYLHNESFEKS